MMHKINKKKSRNENTPPGCPAQKQQHSDNQIKPNFSHLQWRGKNRRAGLERNGERREPIASRAAESQLWRTPQERRRAGLQFRLKRGVAVRAAVLIFV
ncbi:hypothetical protein DM860_009032 [Cuscuta australis]|uniref:Uncharacterized protein n=1 Tax=Cuscuta australis TaxID=267555 RepID=A0A328D9K6_9ASTE|nr:hypothetical protein DM860_009032 [Cuscuta australis]